MKKLEEFKISSETDLEREFDSISSQLQDTSIIYLETDWNHRIKAIKRMQALISSDFIAFENFPTLFLKFTAPLSIQLQDLRSAVVKEAAGTVVLAASVLGDSFELCAERLSDVLYKLINSGNKILAETGSDCFIEVIKSVVTWRLVPKTLEQFSCKNPNIRVKACMFLQTMLEIYPSEVFEYAANNKSGFLEKIEQGLKIAVHDATSDARAIARKAFLNYRNLFPVRANKLFQTFDSSIQRAFGELTDARTVGTPARSTSSNSNRMATSASKIETKSVEKKPRSSLTEVRDLSSTGGTTPEVKPVKEQREPVKVVEKKESPGLDVWIHITNDANWEARVMAFENIKKSVLEDKSMRMLNTNKNLWEQLMNAHFDQMLFSNFRVVAGCLSSLTVVTENYPEKISLALEKILPRLLVCLSSNKEPVINNSNMLLDLIIDIYIPEDLLALLLKYSVQEVKPNIYPKYVEVVYKLAESSTEFFTISQNVKLYMLKMVNVLKESSNSHVRNLIFAFELALERNKKETISVVFDFNSSDMNLLRGALQEFRSPMEAIFREMVKETQKSVPQLQEVKKRPEKPVNTDNKLPSRNSNTFSPTTQEIKPTASQSYKPVQQEPEPKIQKEFKPTVVQEQKIVVLHTEVKTLPVQDVKKPMSQEFKKPTVQTTEIKKQVKEETKSFSPGSRQENLKRVKTLNDELDSIEFDRCFRDVLNILELCVEDSALIEASVMTFQNILQRRKAICLNYLPECLYIMSKGFSSESRHLSQVTEETIEEFVTDQPSNVIVPVLIQSIKLSEVPAVQAFIRILTKVVIVTKAAQLLPLLRTVINQMKDSLNHSNADVRKSVVFCLVEIQGIIGNEFNLYLEELTPSQQKLVTIYIQRRLTS